MKRLIHIIYKMKILPNLQTFLGLGESMQELVKAKKRKRTRKVVVKLIKDNRLIETYKGELTEDKRYVNVDGIMSAYIKPIIYDDLSTGEQIVFIPENTHGNISHKNILNFSKAQQIEIFAKWKKNKEWINMKWITTGTIDWNLFDNDFSSDFANDTHLITHSTALRFLKEMANWKILLACVASLLLGLLFGGFGMSILNILYNLLWYLG